MAEIQQKRGMFALVSDLLAPIDTLDSRFGFLRARGHEVVVFQVLDPRELDFGFEMPSQFVDLESGEEYFIDPSKAKKEYKDRLSEHQGRVRALCERRGIGFHLMRTDEPLEMALHRFLAGRTAGTSLKGGGTSRR